MNYTSFSNVLMFPYDQIWIYCVFLFFFLLVIENHWQILSQEQLAEYSPFSEGFVFEGHNVITAAQ